MYAGIDVTGAFWKYRTGVQNYYHGLMEGFSSLNLGEDETKVILIDRNATESHAAMLCLANPLLDYRSAAQSRLLPAIDAGRRAGGLARAAVQAWNSGARFGNWAAARYRRTTQRMLQDLQVLQVWNWGLQRGPSRHVIMMHDVIPLLFPHLYRQHFVWLTKASMAFARDEATIVITPSTHVKQELMALGGVPEHKICVIHHGIDRMFQRTTDTNKIVGALRKYGLVDVPYLLTAGFLDPRKNISGHIKALERIIADRRMSDLRLVLVGPKILKTKSLLEQIKTSSVRDRIVLTGYVPREELPLLYGGAQAFLYCSKYEGFGLPVLEAMACGTPVVTSNTTSLPEISGGAALLVDPTDPDDIAAAISRIARDEALRRDLTARGLARAARFSWQKCAREHLQVYQEACQ
jgi:glycosyltransferase involved in cell wall biosynthesis